MLSKLSSSANTTQKRLPNFNHHRRMVAASTDADADAVATHLSTTWSQLDSMSSSLISRPASPEGLLVLSLCQRRNEQRVMSRGFVVAPTLHPSRCLFLPTPKPSPCTVCLPSQPLLEPEPPLRDSVPAHGHKKLHDQPTNHPNPHPHPHRHAIATA